MSQKAHLALWGAALSNVCLQQTGGMGGGMGAGGYALG